MNAPAMNKIGAIPSPYGVPINVYFDRTRADDEADCYFHDMDGCMTMAGIHDPAARSRCKEAVKAVMGRGGIPFQVFTDHGGHKVPKVAITSPLVPAYTEMKSILSHSTEAKAVVENWVTLALDQRDWATRTTAFLEATGSARKSMKEWSAPDFVGGIVLSKSMTAGIEHLAETEIDCLEAAAFYAISSHQMWRAAGVSWLEQFRGTWFRDWARKRPAYRRLACACTEAFPDIPAWLVSGGAP